MFSVSEPFLLFDYFRVPCALSAGGAAAAPYATVRAPGAGDGALYWVPASSPAPGRVEGAYRFGSIPVFGGALPDAAAASWLARIGGDWKRATPLADWRGGAVGSSWTSADGSVFLPFDPNEAIRCFWDERYAKLLGSRLARRTRSLANRGYYMVRPAIPPRGRIALRRRFSSVQLRRPFPRWPIETALHDLYEELFGIAAALAGRPVPMIAPWPHGHRWALILTHDVETPSGFEHIGRLCDIETRADYRSSWNFVPTDGHGLRALIDGLKSDGFEVGVHGLYHDGRDIAQLSKRLPHIRGYAERWGASGFRSPATLREWNSIRTLPFDYDSSYFDTSPFEPQPGGCCTWLPYMIGDIVELPITLAQDHTVFEILRGSDARLWLDKAQRLRERGGMALVLTHPDYADNDRLLAAYARLLDEFADDVSAWKALPRDVSDWWRRRAATALRATEDGWALDGPAAVDGSVAYAGPDGAP